MLPSVKWKSGNWLRDVLLTLVLFIWLYQLLTPLGKTGGIKDMDQFFLFIAGLLLLDLVIPWRLVRGFVKLGVLLAFLYQMFYTGIPILEIHWLENLLSSVNMGLFYALQRKYLLVDSAAQTFFFMLFLWLTASVFRNALGSRVWLFVLLFIGEVVIGVIDTFFPFDSSEYIVLYFLVGFILLALSQLPELEKWARIPDKARGWPGKWIVWTILVPLLAVGTGMAAPKYPPAWPDPVSFLQGKGGGQGTAGPKRIGYSNNDESLGGGFLIDETVAFTVVTAERGYYRGESKTLYTGKGWQSTGGSRPLNGQFADVADRQSFGILPEAKTKKVEQEIKIENGRFDVLFSQYQFSDFSNLSGRNLVIHSYNPKDWKVSALLQPGDTYKVTSEVPYYEPEQFKKDKANNSNGYLLQNRAGEYLQLPEALPLRVKGLASQLTADKQSVYEKAKAIEEYLRLNYSYQIEDVPYPAEGQDFVDQFLFDTKRGYCDHFSSSMVVLARAAGLPARWVKGFTEGSAEGTVEKDGKSLTKYVVRNRNAHSWPEVYIPGTGWLPFEPTSGFSQPVIQEASVPVVAPASQDVQDKQRQNMPEGSDPSVDVTYETDWADIGIKTSVVMIVLLVIVAVFRKQLLVAYFIRTSYSGGTDGKSTLVKAMERLLSALRLFGVKKQDNWTIREFGGEIASTGYRGNEWSLFARLFERARYGNKQLDKKEMRETKDLWERIVRKIGRTKKH